MGTFDRLKSIFRVGGKSVIGIDIGSSGVKIVQLRKEKGIAILETYGSLSIGPYAEKDIGASVSADENVIHTVLEVLMKEANITSRLSGISIPFKSSLISLIKVPAVTDDKISQIIPFEARKHVPVPLEDVSIDWFVVPSSLLEPDVAPIREDGAPLPPKEESREVLLIAIHNHELVKYKKIIETSKLDAKFFEIEIFSTLRSVVPDNRYPLMIIDIGASTTKFYVLEHGIVLRSYFINHGGQSVTNAIKNAQNITFKEAERRKREFGTDIGNEATKAAIKSVLSEIFVEANNAIRDFETRYHQNIAKAILTGGGSTLKGVLEIAENELKTKVELADPFSRVKHPLFLSNSLRKNGPEFSVAVGCALRMLEK